MILNRTSFFSCVVAFSGSVLVLNGDFLVLSILSTFISWYSPIKNVIITRSEGWKGGELAGSAQKVLTSSSKECWHTHTDGFKGINLPIPNCYMNCFWKLTYLRIPCVLVLLSQFLFHNCASPSLQQESIPFICSSFHPSIYPSMQILLCTFPPGVNTSGPLKTKGKYETA